MFELPEKNSILETYMRTVREVVDRMDDMVVQVSLIRRLSGLLKGGGITDDISNRIAAVIVEELEIECCAVLLRGPDGLLKVEGIKSVFGEFSADTDIQSSISIITKLAAIAGAGNQLLVVDDINNNHCLLDGAHHSLGDRSIIALPLIDQDKVFGVLCATHSAKGYFSEKRQGNLNIIAEHVSVVLVTAGLHDELRQKNQLLEQKVDQRTVQLHQINGELAHKSSELEKFEENYFDLVENSSVMTFRVNERGCLIEANDSLCGFLGKSLEELKQMKIFDFIKEEDRDQVLGMFEKVINHGEAKGEEYRVVNDKLELKNVQINASAQHDTLGNYTGIKIYMIDISEIKLLEHQLSQSRKTEVIGTLASGIAHDFNNMLGGVLGYASYLKNSIEPDNKIFKHLETIEKSASKATKLTKQLLRLSRKEEYDPEPVNFNQVVNESITLLNGSIGEKITIELNLTENLKNVFADATQMSQIVINLCLNAVSAMPAGGVLDISTENVYLDEDFCSSRDNMVPGDYVQFVVSDTGTGMTSEVMSRIFDPFFTTKKAAEGTGLGLPMVARIISNHKGTVTVKSQIGKGSTFTIYLAAETKKGIRRDEPAYEVRRGNETILVVDDEVIIREVASDILGSLGYEVLSAANGREALTIYNQKKDDIDLVIVDILMPGMGGCELLKKLKVSNSDVKAIFSSGFSEETDTVRDAKSDNLDFLPKPYRVNEISEIVRNTLDH
jgi:two-component system, cell cycle sensor histidine kinase and response regulator CckA